jgi:hypothetical protein
MAMPVVVINGVFKMSNGFKAELQRLLAKLLRCFYHGTKIL